MLPYATGPQSRPWRTGLPMLLDGERLLPHGASHSPAVPRQKLMEFPWQFHLVAAAGGSSMEPLKGAKASHSAYASTVDIVLILLEGSSVCSLGVNLHVGLLETKRMAISLLCLTSRFSWLIILKLASLPDCLHIVPAGRFKVSNSSNVCSNMFNGRA